MSKYEGLSRVAKTLRVLGVIWMLVCTAGAVMFALGRETRPLTRDKQIALYEKQVGHSITEEISQGSGKAGRTVGLGIGWALGWIVAGFAS
ncbi:hypothetical protein [Cupriavidus phytorum]|uniref:hypothetical protein n=1 Tax=Cupriavidus phytorum TaxID=3024399 RepID=UPI0011B6434B|nr:hypothetical protein [Cupriavidus alkaliphilus]